MLRLLSDVFPGTTSSLTPNENGSLFMFTMAKAPIHDHRYMAFGNVMSGIEVLKSLEQLGSWRGDVQVRRRCLSRCFPVIPCCCVPVIPSRPTFALLIAESSSCQRTRKQLQFKLLLKARKPHQRQNPTNNDVCLSAMTGAPRSLFTNTHTRLQNSRSGSS
jgi:cyclophilin family peptidyl-prolyl cis-trans isomerase